MIVAAAAGTSLAVVILDSVSEAAVAHRFRRVVTVEAVALIVVTLVTGFLVAASST